MCPRNLATTRSPAPCVPVIRLSAKSSDASLPTLNSPPLLLSPPLPHLLLLFPRICSPLAPSSSPSSWSLHLHPLLPPSSSSSLCLPPPPPPVLLCSFFRPLTAITQLFSLDTTRNEPQRNAHCARENEHAKKKKRKRKRLRSKTRAKTHYQNKQLTLNRTTRKKHRQKQKQMVDRVRLHRRRRQARHRGGEGRARRRRLPRGEPDVRDALGAVGGAAPPGPGRRTDVAGDSISLAK